MLIEGQILAGRYHLEELLHDGGGAVVWAAKDAQTRRAVALKLLSDRLPDLQKNVEWFLQRGQVAMNQLHPFFVPVLDVSTTDKEQPFLVVPLLEGSSLRQRLDDAGPMTPLSAASVVILILTALSEVHRVGRAHGDIKPENIFLDPKADPIRTLDILNLGLSRPMLGDQISTTPRRILGTLDYTAPERLRNPSQDASASADIFALGVILSELLTGNTPLAPLRPEDQLIEKKIADRNSYYLAGNPVPSPGTALPTLSPQLTAVIRRAVSLEPSSRYENAAQMLEELSAAVSDEEALRTTATGASLPSSRGPQLATSQPASAGFAPAPDPSLAATMLGRPEDFDISARVTPTEPIIAPTDRDTDLLELGDAESVRTDVVNTGFSPPPLCDDDERDTLETHIIDTDTVKPPGPPLSDPFAEEGTEEDVEPPSGYARTVVFEAPASFAEPPSAPATAPPPASNPAPAPDEADELEAPKTQIFNPSSVTPTPPPQQMTPAPAAPPPTNAGGLEAAKTMILSPDHDGPTMLLDSSSPAMKDIAGTPPPGPSPIAQPPAPTAFLPGAQAQVGPPSGVQPSAPTPTPPPQSIPVSDGVGPPVWTQPSSADEHPNESARGKKPVKTIALIVLILVVLGALFGGAAYVISALL